MIFANIMQDKERRREYWSRLLQKYRFVIMTDSSFEEKLSLTFSKLNFFSSLVVIIFICFFFNLLLIAYTPLNEYIPGKSSASVQKDLIELSLRSDSLEVLLTNRDVYLNNINNVISGENLVATNEKKKSESEKEREIIFQKSKADSLLRISVEAEDKSSIYVKSTPSNKSLLFFFTCFWFNKR